MSSSAVALSTPAWKVVANRMPDCYTSVSAVGIQPHENKIAVFGFAFHQLYDPFSQTWDDLPPLDPCRICPVVSNNHSVFAIGGGRSGNLLHSLSFDDDLSWKQLAPMTTSHCFCSGAVVLVDHHRDRAFILVAGGQDDMFHVLRSAELYDIQRNEWSPLPSMIHARSEFAMVSVGKRAFVFGGTQGYMHTLDQAEVFDLDTRSWHALPRMPRYRSGGTAVAVSEYILVIGGRDDHGRVLDEVDCFDATTNRWTTERVLLRSSLQIARNGCAAARVRGRQIHVLGGRDQYNNHLNTIERIEFDPYFTILPRLLPLLTKQNKVPLGLWPHIISGCPPSVTFFILCSDKFTLDAVLLHSQPNRSNKRRRVEQQR